MQTYQFQDYLSLIIDSGGRSTYDRYFENEYERIAETNVASKPPDYQVKLTIVDSLPDDLPAMAIRRSVRFKKLFCFEYAIEGLGTPLAQIWFVDHPVSRIYVTAVGVFVQAQVLEPVMYLSFLSQGVLFMHSAGVSTDGAGFIFPAEGGTGKTTLSMGLLADGFSFLGDDLLIVDPSLDLVFPYPRPLHLFTYNVANIAGSAIPKRIVGAIYAKNVIRFFLERVLRNEFLISTRVHADRILPEFQLSKPASIHHVVFLKKEGVSGAVALDTPADVAEHAGVIIDAADLNQSLFEIIEDPSRQAEIRSQELAVASRILQAADGFGYLNTRSIDLGDAGRLVQDLSRL